MSCRFVIASAVAGLALTFCSPNSPHVLGQPGKFEAVITVESAALSPDGSRALLAYKGGENLGIILRLWDVERCQMLHILDGHKDTVRFCAFTPDGKQAVTAGLSGSVIVYDVQRGIAVKNIFAHLHGVAQAALSANGKFLLTRSKVIDDEGNSELKLWDLERASLKWTRPESGVVGGLAVSPDGSYVVAGGSAASAENSKRARLTLWNVGKDELITTLRGDFGWELPVAFSIDGKGIVVGKRASDVPWQRDLCYWDIEAKAETRRIKKAVPGDIRQVPSALSSFQTTADMSVFLGHAWVRQGDTFEPTAMFWDLKGQKTKCLPLKRGLVAFSITGEHALIVYGAYGARRGSDIQLMLWDVMEGRPLRSWSDRPTVPK